MGYKGGSRGDPEYKKGGEGASESATEY